MRVTRVAHEAMTSCGPEKQGNIYGEQRRGSRVAMSMSMMSRMMMCVQRRSLDQRPWCSLGHETVSTVSPHLRDERAFGGSVLRCIGLSEGYRAVLWETGKEASMVMMTTEMGLIG